MLQHTSDLTTQPTSILEMEIVFRRGMRFIHSLWINTVVFAWFPHCPHPMRTYIYKYEAQIFSLCREARLIAGFSNLEASVCNNFTNNEDVYWVETHKRLGISIREHHSLPEPTIADVSFSNTVLNSSWHLNFCHGNAVLQIWRQTKLICCALRGGERVWVFVHVCVENMPWQIPKLLMALLRLLFVF